MSDGRRMAVLLAMLGVVIALMFAAKGWTARGRDDTDDTSVRRLDESRVAQEEERADASEVVGCRFSGPARVHLAPAPPGALVEAWVDGEKVAETEVVSQGDESIYTFTLDGRYAGKTVVFRFPAYPQLSEAGQATCESGQRQTLTLSAESHQGCGGG